MTTEGESGLVGLVNPLKAVTVVPVSFAEAYKVILSLAFKSSICDSDTTYILFKSLGS